MDADNRTPSEEGRRRATSVSRRAVVAAGTGNALEFYDFAIFASLTPVISKLFFPSHEPLAAILSTFALFGVGFVMRPVGAIVFGRVADRRGRKIPLAIAVLIMGVTTVLIGVMPTYPQAGIVAPVLLCIARLLQGLSVGGEFGASASFLVEHAPRHRRGLYGSYAFFSSTLGSVLGALVVLILTWAMSPQDLDGWGWRVPFLLGFPLLVTGLYLRYRIAESPEFEEIQAGNARAKSPLRTLFKQHWPAFLTVIGICVGFNIASSTAQAFVLTYIRNVIGLPALQALTTVVLSAAVGVCLVVVFGYLSDRYGRKPILIFASVMTVALPYPSLLIIGLKGFGPALLGQLILWIPVAAFGGAIPALFAELFPTRVRVSGFGIAYGFGSAIFAGTAPFAATLQIELSGNSLAPAWYMAAAGAVTLTVVIAAVERKQSKARETAHLEGLA
ncbi:MHS family proline/betaine transporter-like MFS transporter [Thermocatellispora tengchongensis]|uniref:Putative proline/betaine transporter n=1 Tax=Thermocatellispora tengchongensis TaxID=1073253 RepID=A0A840PEN3_9ACTN|nr:MFS transporter [Thermocatellispora tengchongensis]MBB5135607.1 MHS family proline/betaine transporter-like MFS transporter [Thermocatellispora tengchongensis]